MMFDAANVYQPPQPNDNKKNRDYNKCLTNTHLTPNATNVTEM